MFSTATERLARLGRWPRRIAAVACLLLAAVSALGAGHDPSAGATARRRHRNPLIARLGPGQVAAPVAVSGGTDYLRAGDRVDLYAAPGPDDAGARACTADSARGSPVARRVRVLALPHDSAGTARTGDSPRLIIAVDRPTAARIAGLQGCGILAVLDKYP